VLLRVFHADSADDRATGVTTRLRIGLIASTALHIAALAVLILGLPASRPKDEPIPEPTVAMVFPGPSQPATKADTPAETQAPAKEAAPPAPPVATPPKPAPTEAAPPPPPPPPPPPQAHVEAAPPKPTPPVPTPPAPAPPTPTPPMPTPPPEPAPTPTVLPPPPPAPSPPSQTTTAERQQPLPLPPPPAPPPPSPPSATSQPNPTKNPAPNSNTVENTLDKLRQQLAQTTPPKSKANPRAGGSPNGGGNPAANDTASLSAAQRGAIGDHVRECWTKDAGALDEDKQRVMLTVTTDANGVARRAEVAGDDVGRMSDVRFRAFAERARRAVLDAHCANLPLPNSALGRINTLTFRFSP
jgi:neural Wiskott-Aldrich syndrome protein